MNKKSINDPLMTDANEPLKDIHGNELVPQESAPATVGPQPVKSMLRDLIRWAKTHRRGRKCVPSFANKNMERGVQMALERKQRPARLAAIYAQMRRGVEVAKENRAAYLQRRGARWRVLIDATAPGIFARQMEKAGLGLEVGSGYGLDF